MKKISFMNSQNFSEKSLNLTNYSVTQDPEYGQILTPAIRYLNPNFGLGCWKHIDFPIGTPRWFLTWITPKLCETNSSKMGKWWRKISSNSCSNSIYRFYPFFGLGFWLFEAITIVLIYFYVIFIWLYQNALMHF